MTSNTIVIFTSDNGGLHVPELTHQRITHNAPYRAGKGFLHEGGLRVPLIVRWPGHVPAGRVADAPVVNTDWLPTLLEWAGRPVPENLDGVSLGGFLTGRSAAPQRVLCWHFPHYTNQGSQPAGAVRDGDWKLIEYYEDHARRAVQPGRGRGRDCTISPTVNPHAWINSVRNWLRGAMGCDVQTNTPNSQYDARVPPRTVRRRGRLAFQPVGSGRGSVAPHA